MLWLRNLRTSSGLRNESEYVALTKGWTF